jgi:hypothetical protein
MPAWVLAFLLVLAFPARHETMGRVMECESRGIVTAQNPRSSAAGLFQITRGSWRWARENGVAVPPFREARYEPGANIAVARWLVREGGGLRHWNASRACWEG